MGRAGDEEKGTAGKVHPSWKDTVNAEMSWWRSIPGISGPRRWNIFGLILRSENQAEMATPDHL